MGHGVGFATLCHGGGHEFLISLSFQQRLLSPTSPQRTTGARTAQVSWPFPSTVPHMDLPQTSAEALPITWVQPIHCLAWLILTYLLPKEVFLTCRLSIPTSSSHYILHYKHLWWKRQRHPTPVLLPGKSHGRRSLEGWTRLSDFTFTFHFDALEKEMATHSSVLAWRIPGTGEPGGLPSMGSHRVGHD